MNLGAIFTGVKSWPTTVGAILAVVPSLLSAFGISIPPDVVDGLTKVGIFVVGLFATTNKKDV